MTMGSPTAAGCAEQRPASPSASVATQIPSANRSVIELSPGKLRVRGPLGGRGQLGGGGMRGGERRDGSGRGKREDGWFHARELTGSVRDSKFCSVAGDARGAAAV